MCTVVFIPGFRSNQFVSLRDENPLRPKAISVSEYQSNNTKYVAPIDTLAGGTWAGITQYGHVIILLNGAHTNHVKKPHYRQSRGQIVLLLLQSATPMLVWKTINLNEIEPFTIVLWDNHCLFELIWDGQTKTVTPKNARLPHIWSSSTLYSQANKAIRHRHFHNWIQANAHTNREQLLRFFQSYQHPLHGFIINRGVQMKTLSYSHIELSHESHATFSYHDFATNSLEHITIPFEKVSIINDEKVLALS